MSIWSKFLAIAAAALLSVSFATVASADINSLLEAGVNLFEDDSGEMVFRYDDVQDSDTFGTYVLVTDGQIAEGDLVIGVFDISWINNNTNVLEPGTEVTGVYIASVADISDVTAAGLFFTGDIEFAAVDPLLASALLGVTASAGDVAWFFEDPNNNLTLSTDDFISAVGNATDGNQILAAAISAPQDFFEGSDVYLDLAAYGVGTPGVSLRGNFEGGLTISDWGLSGDLIAGGMCPFGIFGDCYDMTISGTLLVSDFDGFGIQNDAQFAFKRIPEPSTLGILGMGLLGLGLAGRRRRS